MARDAAWRELAASGRLGQFVLLCLGIFLHAADTLATATLMPTAVAEIGGVAYVNWTISLYQIGSIVAGAAAGALSRRAGLRRVLLASATTYGIGCVVSALAGDMGTMLAGRLVQGAGGGMMVALSYVAVQLLFPEHLWTRLLAVLSAIWGAASLIGPLIGGLFGAAGLWRGAFWLFAGLAALLVASAAVYLREPAGAGPRRGWSWPPLLLLFAATLTIAEAGEVQPPALAAALGVAGLGLLYAAARADGLVRNRLLPSELLDLRHRLGAGLLMVFALSAASTGFWSYGPLILQAAFGIAPLFAGILLAGESIAWSLCTIGVAGLPARFGPRLIAGGVSLAALGSAGLMLFMPIGWLPGIVACVLLQGAGFGISWPFLVARVIAVARPEERDLAAGAAPSMQRIGYAVGAAAAGIAANGAGFAAGASAEAARSAAFWVFAGFVPLLAIALLAVMRFTGPGRLRDDRNAERLQQEY